MKQTISYTGSDKTVFLDNLKLDNVEEIYYTEFKNSGHVEGYMILAQYTHDPSKVFEGKHDLTVLCTHSTTGIHSSETLHGLELYQVERGHTLNDLGSSVKALFKADSISPLHIVTKEVK